MSDLNATIERCPRDKENPYSMISRDLIQDQDLSLECRWLLIYLLSMKSGWKIKAKQIANHTKGKAGIKKIYKLLKEAIASGYMRKEFVMLEGSNLKQGVRYFLSESRNFIDNSNNVSDTAILDTPQMAVLNNKEEELLYSSSSLAGDKASPSPLSQMPSAPSKPVSVTGIRKAEERIDITPQAREFLRAFRAYNPLSTLTELTVQKEFNLWLKEKTANSLMDIQKAAAFAFSDDFWIARISSLKAFKDNFKTILAQAINLEKRKDKKKGTQCYLKNKAVVEKVKKVLITQMKDEIFRIEYADQVNQFKVILANIDLQANSVVNKETGEQLDLNVRDHAEFRQRLERMFGIEIGSDI